MQLQIDCGVREERRLTLRRTLRDYKLRRTLNRYEKFIQWKCGKYARVYEDRNDLQQVGREAVITVFNSIEEGRLRVVQEKGYYLNSVDHAMLDYARKLYRKTYFLWRYDKQSGPTRTKRYRYGGRWKARIQYHGDALKLLDEQRKNVLSYEDIFER